MKARRKNRRITLKAIGVVAQIILVAVIPLAYQYHETLQSSPVVYRDGHKYHLDDFIRDISQYDILPFGEVHKCYMENPGHNKVPLTVQVKFGTIIAAVKKKS